MTPPDGPRLGQARQPAGAGVVDVGLVVPLSGPAGLFGPSSELCAQLAAEEVNAAGGLQGRELRLIVVDGAGPPARVADEVDLLVSCGAVQAVVGWHISAVRQALVPQLAGRVPYIYTALYEGGETAPGVFLTGETPRHQILPSLQWLAREFGVRRWGIVGNDYVWPRRSAAAAHAYMHACGTEVSHEAFVRLGTTDFSREIRHLEVSGCDAVLMLLVGSDAVHFNRQFAASQLDQRCLRLSPLMDENMLLATGAENSRGVFTSAGYFDGLDTPDSADFKRRYTARYGPSAPVLNSPGESCYEGVRLLSELLVRAGSTSVPAVCRAAAGTRYEGPRGHVALRNGHVDQTIYLAQASGLQLEVVSSL
ncbi:MAG TPA: substrate-binding domain-containing protein [Mycobacteriales bacterium]|nr:substrate-binding domain-containing protein [Mycobacteriales bacterium]